MSTKVSVVIPTYEPDRFLRDTLTSVLMQDPGSDVMQIAIVDDASKKTHPAEFVASIAAPGRIEIHEHEENLGLAGNWNRAVALARGEFIHILHQDDLIERDFYSKLLAGLDSAPTIGMAFCRHGFIDESGHVERISHRERWRAGVLAHWVERISETQRIQCPAAVVRRAVYEELGGFKGELRYALDWEMWVRIAARYDVWYEPDVLAYYRRHPEAESARLEAEGKVNEDLMNAIDMFSAHLPEQHRALLRKRAYRRLTQTRLRRASKLLEGRSPQGAAAHVACARAALEHLPEDFAKWWVRSKLTRLEARVASRTALTDQKS